ncbi:hypothetical protein JT359_05505 [Candidatus Poribacteria bacterium]|nr:hypothetical protein [Candidatus Poribacteria bacterium]
MVRGIIRLFILVFSISFLYGNITVCYSNTEEQHPSAKRVGVLYFEDNSRFDSSTGCGCVPNFIGRIFSTKKMWDLEVGFQTMLNRKLAETVVYVPVSQDELLDAMAELTIPRHRLKKLNQEQRSALAKHLNADILVLGEIEKFSLSRMKANASRSLRESGREAPSTSITASYMTGVGVMGYRHRALVKLNMEIYDDSGNEIATFPVTSTRYHSLAGTQVSGFQASVTETGSEMRFGQMSEKHGKNTRPIVKPTQLNKIKFASPEYDTTLFGMVTNDVLIKVVKGLRDSYGPNFITPWEVEVTTEENEKEVKQVSDKPIKITYVDSENPDLIYINAGSARGLAINQKFAVFTDGKPIRDIDTGDILDYIPVKIAIVSVIEIRNDRLSIVKVLEKSRDIKRGDFLKVFTTDGVEKEE